MIQAGIPVIPGNNDGITDCETGKSVAEEVAVSYTHLDVYKRQLQSIGKRLKVPEEKIPTNVSEYGNVSSACIPILLDELYAAGKLKKGDKIIMAGFGAGVTLSASYMEI